MKILLLEPFFGGSHKRWAEGYRQYSRHEVQILHLKGRHWKWRMFGGAVSLAEQFMNSTFQPDLILATDMLDVSTFLGLAREKAAGIPVATYFHENQITYPWSPDDPDLALHRNIQYGFINYTSALASSKVLFNSPYHRHAFLENLPDFLRQFPDARSLNRVGEIAQKSMVLPLGLSLAWMDAHEARPMYPEATLLWNHRWEYDKNPEFFFRQLFRLKEEGHRFRLIVLGESYRQFPPVFDEARKRLGDEIIHFGYVEEPGEYARLLWQADILPVTSRQDFFGGSIVEAIYCRCFPLLPNRLAYPMHIPADKQATHLYHSEEGLYEKLAEALHHIEKIRQQDGIRHFVAQYDWSNLVHEYDGILENVAAAK